MRSPPLLDAVEELIGPDILCWSTECCVRQPASAQFMPWRRDAGRRDMDAGRMMSAWVALSPARAADGCLRCIPVSHLGDGAAIGGEGAIDVEIGTGEAALFARRTGADCR